MARRAIRGLSAAYRNEMIGLCADLAATADLDDEVRRRALWLQWGLQGYEPGTEPLPFVDAGDRMSEVAGEKRTERDDYLSSVI